MNKHNGAVAFGLGTTGTVVTNEGTIHVNNGELFANSTTINNNGTLNFGAGSSLRSNTTNFNNNSTGVITGLPLLVLQGNNFNVNASTVINILPQANLNGGTLNLAEPLQVLGLNLAGSTISGPAAISVLAGGSFNWTGGTIGPNAVIDLAAGSTGTINAGGSLNNNGIINNAGTFTLANGVATFGLGAPPATFNNLPGAVLDLNNWPPGNDGSTWHLTTNNQGTINHNNPGRTFTISFRPLTNDGVVNINGNLLAVSAAGGVNNATFIGGGGHLPHTCQLHECGRWFHERA